jgi:nitrite reductase/ring-hydroxylating ferredoxin subunit
VGGGVILDNADYVVTQPSKGTFKAFTSICTHMRCKVAEVSGGFIRCSCHGSQFSIKDGSVANPPASQPLAEHEVAVSGGKVFVTE